MDAGRLAPFRCLCWGHGYLGKKSLHVSNVSLFHVYSALQSLSFDFRESTDLGLGEGVVKSGIVSSPASPQGKNIAVAAVIEPIEALRFGAYFRCETAYCGGCESFPIVGSRDRRVVCIAPFGPPHVGGTEWCGDTQSHFSPPCFPSAFPGGLNDRRKPYFGQGKSDADT